MMIICSCESVARMTSLKGKKNLLSTTPDTRLNVI